VQPKIKQYIGKLLTSFKPVPWVGRDFMKYDLIKAKGGAKCYKIDRSVTIAANRSNISIALRKLLTTAKAKF